jgi:hypothetical protein
MSAAESGKAPSPIPVSRASEATVRLARLRREFVALYPGLDAGPWYPAASVEAYFRAWLSRHPDPERRTAPLRGLDTAHFEFQGGVPRETPWLPGQSPDERAPVRAHRSS